MVSRQISFGSGFDVELALPADAMIADCHSPREGSLEDTVFAMAAALVEPLEFPPLAEATVPGDRIALAVEWGVPQATSVVAGVVSTIMESATSPESITIVHAEDDPHASSETWTSQLAQAHQDFVRVIKHDPSDRKSLAYLAVSRDREPIYVNRAIADADFLIPIGCIRPEGTLGYLGASAGLFPTFADDATQKRFRAPISCHSTVHRNRRQREAEEAAWLLGSRFTVQVIPGTGDRVLRALAGDVDAVVSRGRELARTAWNCVIPRRARLVVATIEGGPDQQTWENVAQSLSSALRIVDDEGVIVVCSSLQSPPGASLCRLAGCHTLDSAELEINRDRTPDAVAAWQLVQTMRRVKVYLLSCLGAEVVEGMGIGHVSHHEEISRLASRYSPCALLANSQHAIPVLEEELERP